jgi:ribonuclease J
MLDPTLININGGFNLSKIDNDVISIFALGGLCEIGKNMYCIQYENEMIVIDAGVKFPEKDMPGIDLIIPDISHLIENQEKIRGIFLTHGHEDHIGAMPFVLRELNVPVYGGALTLGLVRSKLEEHGLLHDAQLNLIDDDTEVHFKHISISFFRTNHSIPDSFGIAVNTPQGVIVQTGDFKFDHTPADKPTDLIKMAEIGKRGVLALLSDSTNSEREGFTPSETTVGNSIRDLFGKCTGRILFATFASNVHRLQQVVEAAQAYGRKIAVIGRSMEKVFQIGQNLGYIRVPEGMIIDTKEINKFSSNQIAIICTGSQGEPNAALTRIARSSHRQVEIHPGDTVIFSASPIPGNTQNVYRSIDLLYRAGAEVIYGSILDIHASGHGSQEDLKLMLNLMKPHYFIPIHGEYRMLVRHASLAEQTGVEKANIFLLNIGNVLHLSREKAEKGVNVHSGSSLVEGNNVSTIRETVMDDRIQLSNNGLIIIAMTVEEKTLRLLSGPDIVSRGFIYVREARELIKKSENRARKIVNELLEQEGNSIEVLKEKLNKELSFFFNKELGRSPIILPIIMTTNKSQSK